MSEINPNGLLKMLKRYADSLDELRATGVIRSKNNPLADYAEWLACESLGLSRCAKSTRGHDAIDKAGMKYEVKARRLTPDNASRQLSAIRGLDSNHFDYLIGILFNRDFTVLRGALISWEIVNQSSVYKQHTNASILHLRDSVWDLPRVIDITKKLKATEIQL